MKKGFIVALMTVSIASAMVSGSYASAPVIRDLPDIIIGDEATGLATSAQTFVFPDALDLRAYFTSDNDSTSVSVKWSYLDTADEISINGVPSVTSDPINPSAGDRITTNDTDSAQVDGDPFTITFRNKYFSPDGGPNDLHSLPEFSDPLTSVSVLATNELTLFASDGATYTAKPLTVYTVNNTSDGLSGGLTFTLENNPDFSGGSANSWTGTLLTAGGSFAARSGVGGSGLCMDTNANPATNSFTQWKSPLQYVDLKDNTLYRVRFSMNTSQATPGNIPFWRLGYINLNGLGQQNYGGQRFFLSASGGASGIGTPNGRTDFETWIAPNPMSTPQWRDPSTGAFAPAYAGSENFQFDFTLFDNNTNINTQVRVGTVCLSSMTVESTPATSLLGSGTTVYSTPISSSAHVLTSLGAGDTGAFVGNTAEMDLAIDAPGATGGEALAPGPLATNTTAYPILWEGDVLYGLEADLRLKVPNTGDPVQLITLVMSVPSNEQIVDDYSFRGQPGYMQLAASPTVAASTYRNWWYSNNVSTGAGLINGADLQRFGWQVQVFSNGNLNNNKGGDTTVVDNVRVLKYTVPVYPN